MYMQSGEQECWGIMRSEIGEAYFEKHRFFQDLIEQQGQDLTSFVHEVFEDQYFSESDVKKVDFVTQILVDKLSVKSWRFLRKKLRRLAYLTDRRHPEEYVFDIILGWLTEELVINQINDCSSQNLEVQRIGIDSERELLSLNIRAIADIQIIHEGRDPIKIDIFADHRGTWVSNGYMDLKKGKIKHFEQGKLDYVLGLDVENVNWHLVDKAMATGLKLSPNPAMGGTLTVQVPLPATATIAHILDVILMNNQG